MGEIKGGNFDSYKHKRATDHNEQALITFFKRMGLKDHEIQGELDVHRIEIGSVM